MKVILYSLLVTLESHLTLCKNLCILSQRSGDSQDFNSFSRQKMTSKLIDAKTKIMKDTSIQ